MVDGNLQQSFVWRSNSLCMEVECSHTKVTLWSAALYRTIKLLEHWMKVMRKMLESRLRSHVMMDEMPHVSKCTKILFSSWRSCKKSTSKTKSKNLYSFFFDLEEVFDRVQERQFDGLWDVQGMWSTCRAIVALYEESWIMMWTNIGDSKNFPAEHWCSPEIGLDSSLVFHHHWSSLQGLSQWFTMRNTCRLS